MRAQQIRCDYHVHIGQYGAAYYFADRVFAALYAAGVREVWFSSTTSCLYCKESAAARAEKSIYEAAPTAFDLYEGVRREVRDALNAAEEIGMQAHALYWVVPDVHFAKSAGVTIERAMAETPYDGFKIHPRAQAWNVHDAHTASLAKSVFDYAERHGKRILIHCGEDTCDSPRLFEPFIKAHPRALVQLAHCRPVSETLTMLKNYPNTVCDTAMAAEDAVQQIRAAGYGGRLVYGSDFPITHWHSSHPTHAPMETELRESITGAIK